MSIKRCMAAGGMYEGVPPPKKIVLNSVMSGLRLQIRNSVSSEATTSLTMLSMPAYVLKSQYVHLVRQNGIWI